MRLLSQLHGRHVHPRRVRVLRDCLEPFIHHGAKLLDVGCGDGRLARALQQSRPDISIEGVDTLVRPRAEIRVAHFDGMQLPYPDREFDAVLLVDVLHHAKRPWLLLAESLRVSRGTLLLKDHLRTGMFASVMLRFMDWVGNAGHGVALPYEYWSRTEWQDRFEELELIPVAWNENPRLYPVPASWLFGRSLHFVARLERRDSA